jgi:hypothetical protein
MALFNLSKLSVWWLRLGIEIERIKPGHPQQRAGTEYVLQAGDTIYHDGDLEHGYRNDGRTPCIYYLAMDVAGKAT